jgi:hypothetical protein
MFELAKGSRVVSRDITKMIWRRVEVVFTDSGHDTRQGETSNGILDQVWPARTNKGGSLTISTVVVGCMRVAGKREDSVSGTPMRCAVVLSGNGCAYLAMATTALDTVLE